MIHLPHDENTDLKIELVKLCQQVIAGELDIVQGCMLIEPFLIHFGMDMHSDLLVIKAVDSDSDRFAFGETRKLWSPELLAERDREKDETAESNRAHVIAACERIMSHFYNSGDQ
jgi:hypothetical protein